MYDLTEYILVVFLIEKAFSLEKGMMNYRTVEV